MNIFNFLSNFFSNYGYSAVFIVLILSGLGLPLPEDVTLLAAGFITEIGNANIYIMLVVGMLGVLIGDSIVFGTGRILGPKALRFKFVSRYLTPKRFMKVQKKFDKYGNWVLFFARFLPGLRIAIFIIAGLTKKVSYFRFLLLDGLAALISVPIWILLGYYGAQNIDLLLIHIKKFQNIIMLIVILIVILFIIYYFVRLHKRKQRIKRRN